MRVKHAVAMCMVVVALSSCQSVEGRKDLLDFIVDGSTSKDDAYLHLGTPSASFEAGRILAYRLERNDSGYYVVAPSPSSLVVPRYSLILVFGEDGKLRRHSLVEVHPK